MSGWKWICTWNWRSCATLFFNLWRHVFHILHYKWNSVSFGFMSQLYKIPAHALSSQIMLRAPFTWYWLVCRRKLNLPFCSSIGIWLHATLCTVCMMQYNKLIRSYVFMVWRDLRPIILVWNVNACLLSKQFMLQLLSSSVHSLPRLAKVSLRTFLKKKHPQKE